MFNEWLSNQKQPPRLFSKISLLLFQEHLFLDFSRWLYVFTEQMPIFQEGLSVRRTDTNFQEDVVCSPNRYHFSKSPLYVFIEQIPIFQEHLFSYRTDTIFPGTFFMCSPNRYQFSRSIFFATEKILIFQEHFFSYRTDTNFPGSLFRISTNR